MGRPVYTHTHTLTVQIRHDCACARVCVCIASLVVSYIEKVRIVLLLKASFHNRVNDTLLTHLRFLRERYNALSVCQA